MHPSQTFPFRFRLSFVRRDARLLAMENDMLEIMENGESGHPVGRVKTNVLELVL
jgi:hypothetical protein